MTVDFHVHFTVCVMFTGVCMCVGCVGCVRVCVGVYDCDGSIDYRSFSIHSKNISCIQIISNKT